MNRPTPPKELPANASAKAEARYWKALDAYHVAHHRWLRSFPSGTRIMAFTSGRSRTPVAGTILADTRDHYGKQQPLWIQDGGKVIRMLHDIESLI